MNNSLKLLLVGDVMLGRLVNERLRKEPPEYKDLYVCIRDAFAAARRRLEDYARIMRGDTKRHIAPAHA